MKVRYHPPAEMPGAGHGLWVIWMPGNRMEAKRNFFVTTLYMCLYMGAIELDQK